MMDGREAVIGRCRPDGRHLVWALSLSLVMSSACDPCGWNEECDYFTCETDSVVVVVGETKAFPPFPASCHPWSGPEAAYTVRVLDATIVTATIEDRKLLITGHAAGDTYVFVDATVEGDPNIVQFAYHVTTIEPPG